MPIAYIVVLLEHVYLWTTFLLAPRGWSYGMESPQGALLEWGPLIFFSILGAMLVARGSYPIWAVLASVAVAFSSLLVVFSQYYYSIGDASNFGGVSLSKLDAFYFALGTLTTAGTGSISPTSELSRGVVSAQLVVNTILTGFAVAMTATRLSTRRSRTPNPSAPTAPKEPADGRSAGDLAATAVEDGRPASEGSSGSED